MSADDTVRRVPRTAGRRSAWLPLLAAACAGLNVWLSMGAVAVTTAPRALSRIGVLPPLWLLIALFAGAVASARLTGMSPRRATPLFFSFILALPWIPGPVPKAFLLWTGPLVWLVWLVIAAGMLLAEPLPLPRVPATVARDARRAPLAAALLASVAYTSAAAWLSFKPGGDEPHYLIITQSLLYDGDLKIENNHRLGQFSSYMAGDLKPDYLKRGRDGQIYSVHAPGLPVIIAPAFAFFGHKGAILFLALVSGAASALVWRACHLISGSIAASWFGWASVSLTVPFFFQAFSVFPDGLGAALVMVGVTALIRAGRATRAGLKPCAPGAHRNIGGPDHPHVDDRLAPWFWYGAALALLPWLHTRFVLIACTLGLCLFARLKDEGRARAWRRAAALGACPCVSAVAWLLFFYWIYGTPDPSAPYGGYPQSGIGTLLAGVTGLLFDQQFGLIPNAPVYVLAAAGLVSLARTDPRLAIELVLIILPYLCAVAGYRMWWGGHSAPARFLVASLLPLGIPAALWFSTRQDRAAKVFATLLLVVSLFGTAVLLVPGHGRMLYNERNGSALSLQWLSPVVSLSRGLPSLFQESLWDTLSATIVWAAAISLACLTMRGFRRRVCVHDGAAALAALTLMALATLAVVTANWRAGRVDGLTTTAGQLELLRRMEGGCLTSAVGYTPFQLLRKDEAVRRLDLTPALRRTRADERSFSLPDVPAGTYRIRMWLAAKKSVTAELVTGRAPFVLDSWTSDADRAAVIDHDVTLAVGLSSMTIREAVGSAAIDRFAIQPLAIGGLMRGTTAKSAVRTASGVLYFFDAALYAEPGGFWIEGGGAGRTLVAPESGMAPASLFIRNAPVPNHLSISIRSVVDGSVEPRQEPAVWQREVDAAAGREMLIPWPVSARAEAFVLTVKAEEGFKPGLIDPRSRDFRTLGCWVEIR